VIRKATEVRKHGSEVKLAPTLCRAAADQTVLKKSEPARRIRNPVLIAMAKPKLRDEENSS
jgi:hypothetical protein